MKKISLDTLTGEEFKELIEQFTDDGKVNTIPELMERIGEIPDDETLEEYITKTAKQSAIDKDTIKEVVDESVDEAMKENVPERVTKEEIEDFNV